MAADQPNYLDIVPPELWHLCWANCERTHLHQLCLTCKTFRDICQPFLFHHRHITIPRQPERISAQELIRTLGKLAGSFGDFSRHNRLTLYVKSLCLADHLAEGVGNPDVVRAVTRYKQIVPKAYMVRLAAFRNIRSMSLVRIDIQGDARKALDALPSLRYLDLNQCHVASGGLLALESLVLVDCVVENAAEPPALHIVDPKNIQGLFMSGNHQHLAHVGVLLALPEVLPQLVHLKLNMFCIPPPLLFAFLAKCSRVERIILDQPLMDEGNLPLDLPDGCLPNVREAQCTYDLVTALIPGRLIKSLTLFRHGDDSNDQSLLGALRVASIRTLQTLILSSPIPAGEILLVFHVLESTLAHLRELTITLECIAREAPAGFMTFVSLLSANEIMLPAALETLHIQVVTPRYPLEFTQVYALLDPIEMAEQLAEPQATRALTRFSFDYEHKWDVCRRDGSGQWGFERRELIF